MTTQDVNTATMTISSLNKQSVSAWETNAVYWDSAMGHTGNSYFRDLELPALEKLVDPKAGENAVDLATGNGLVARWLAAKGCTVLATDASLPLLDIARKRTAEGGVSEDRVSFRQLDVTDAKALNDLIKGDDAENGDYDIITMNMALMDIATVDPLAQVLPRLLRKSGRQIRRNDPSSSVQQSIGCKGH
ncbi:MAG: hypothetical protein M1816_004111 [Peltula sp. TS41687]|nr:MAG: hypothetical protein M1816_004111 [Peltula sp. TS41687]